MPKPWFVKYINNERCVWMVNMLKCSSCGFINTNAQTVRMKPIATLVKYINNVPMEVP